MPPASRPIVLLLIAIGSSACGHPAERAVLERFFSAARLRDNTALAAMSSVRFEPTAQGIVADFSVERVTPEERSGSLVSKSATVAAHVRLPDGTTEPRLLFVTMQRDGDRPWMITGLIVAAAPPSPQSR
jgi:hypothetical protein